MLCWQGKCVISKPLVHLLFLVLIFQGCTSLFFYPDQQIYKTPEELGLKYTDVYFESEDTTALHAWHIFPTEPSKGLVFVAHGNAQNLSAHFLGWTWLVEAGYEVFIFDYRGYGASQGEASVEGAIADTQAALDYVDAHYAGQYVACGQSLGGTILINAMVQKERQKVEAVVIDSTFRSFSEIASEKMDQIIWTWPFQWIPYLSMDGQYDAQDKIASIGKPVLFLHGSQDTVISANDSWQLFERSKAPREIWLVKPAGHIEGFQSQAVQKDFVVYLNTIKRHYSSAYAQMRIYE